MRALMLEDLAKSGLTPEDINARILDAPERAATNTSHSTEGYIIPYITFSGKPTNFYRVRRFEQLPKYKQVKDSQNHVYFPPAFQAALKGKNYIIITEGEKKAALACKLGHPTCALSGVDSWRTRTVILPDKTELTPTKKGIQAKLPSGEETSDGAEDSIAVGLAEVIDHACQNNCHIVIIFDSDEHIGLKTQVQRAASALGFELRFRGMLFNRIRQAVLPPLPKSAETPDGKVALDDFLQKQPEAFKKLIYDTLEKRSAFPRHPNIREFLNRRLQRNLRRKDLQSTALAILSDLDANGLRLRSKTDGTGYYFDFLSRRLFKAEFLRKDFFDTAMGQFLYRRFGLSSGADFKLFEWLASQFTGEDPIEEVSPYRVFARPEVNEDCVYYQISDSQYVRVDKDGIEVYDNGENNILFESDQVEGLNTEKLLEAFGSGVKPNGRLPVLPCHWSEVLSHVRLRDQDKQRQIAALLYYLSPWLHRWRGMQLPVELILGESGSGKSTLCEARLTVISGHPNLRNAPTDLKDWHASISSTGGLHVTDNVQFADRTLRQRLSDEICRIVTEPMPFIEQRRLYTNADLVRIPVRSVFAITAIQQPFQNADLIQRSVILHLDKMAAQTSSEGITYDSNWKNSQIAQYGGREGWIAHHMMVLQRFFQLVHEKWNDKYLAKYRLINFEQAMLLMAQVFGFESQWIPQYLNQAVESTITSSDWTLEGLKAFSDEMAPNFAPNNFIMASHIAEWALSKEEFADCENLTNARKLGWYLQTHKSLVASTTGLIQTGLRQNRACFKIMRPEKTP